MSGGDQFSASDIYKSDTRMLFDSDDLDDPHVMNGTKDIQTLTSVPSLNLGSSYNSVESYSSKMKSRFPIMMTNLINQLSPRPAIVNPGGHTDDVEELEYSEPLMSLIDNIDNNDTATDDIRDRTYLDNQQHGIQRQSARKEDVVLSGRSRRHTVPEL